MDLSFAKDPKVWTKAIESMRGKVPMTEENIRKAYEQAEKGEDVVETTKKKEETPEETTKKRSRKSK